LKQKLHRKLKHILRVMHCLVLYGFQIGTHIGFWWESQKERDHYEDLDLGGRIKLRWILERSDGVLWTALIWLRIGTSGGLL
jgi:hypothetical protein